NVRELENCLERAILLSQGQTIVEKHLPERLGRRETPVPREDHSVRKGLKRMIQAALEDSGGNVSQAARQLQISRSTLYRKIKDFGLDG
ncbi:MAG: helix-turn-helix domain-containing protein, partial [Deltaproteobacteria bacterium]|nr:helix-turn-helix domain-containing protein [Deltaproteobacteria bacterium]